MKSKTVKSILSIVLATMMYLSLLPTTAFATDSEFDISGDVLLKYIGSGGDVVIPDGITSIDKAAFFKCMGLKSIILPDSITSIGDSAFDGCSNLSSVTMPNSVTKIGNYAFMNCTSITRITIPASVGDNTFYACKGLTNVTILDGATSIGSEAFAECINLKTIIIPNSITNIGNSAFRSCEKLTSITIPDSVASIDYDTFMYCSSLKDLTIGKGIKNIEASAFDYCSSLTKVNIPDGVISIGHMAFANCQNLTNISIPASVTKMGGLIDDPHLFTKGGNLKSDILITGEAGSYAQSYAKKHNLSFISTDSAVTPASDKPSAWAEIPVNTAITESIVPKDLQCKYKQATTRAEFCALATTLYEKVKGVEIDKHQTFSDTTDINIQKMTGIGVVTGVGNNNFAPNDKLTREQAATMLARLASAIGKPLKEQAATFTDNSKISSWATIAVGQVQATEVMSGVGNNTFDPKSDYTREQSISTMLRLCDILK